MTIEFNDKGKIFTDIIRKDITPATLYTLTHCILGKIHVRMDERFKDALNEPEHFIAITDAEVYTHQGELVHTSDFLAVNRDHIIWVLPEMEISPTPSQPGGAK